MSKMTLGGKTIVITGAASGIGRALAIECVTRGAHVALADINLEGARKTVGYATAAGTTSSRCSAHQLDVSQLAHWQRFHREVIEDHGVVDGIINNAGVTFAGTVEETTYEQLERVMSINFMGMVYGTKEFLPSLRDRPQAFVANVSSVLGLYAVKSQSAYCASKYAIRGFTEALAQELKSTNVHVASIHPGHIGTNILKSALASGNVAATGLSDEEKEGYVHAFKAMGLSTQKAATIILDGLQKQKSKITVGKDADRGDLLSRLFPTQFVNKLNAATP